MEKINRRKLLVGTAAATLSSVTLAKTMKSEAKVKWTCIASWPPELSILMDGAKNIAQRVSELSSGSFQIDIVVDGEINKDMDLLDAVGKGVAQCGHTASDYFSNRNPALNLLNSAPFGLTFEEHLSWLQFGGGLALAQELYAPFNIVYFPAGNTGSKFGGWFNKEINTLSDLKGVKIRISGLPAEVFKQVGATPMEIPYLKLASEMKAGKVDAVAFTGPFDDLKLGLDKVAKYYYAPGWWHVGDQLDLLINRQAYDALSDLNKAILKTAAYEINSLLTAEYIYQNAKGLKDIRDQGKVQLKQFPLEFLSQAYHISMEIQQKNAAKYPMYRKVYESWLKHYETAEFFRRYIRKPLMDFPR